MYVELKDLPDSLQSALYSVRYGKRDIQITPATTYSLNGGLSGAGCRAFTMCVNLATGERHTELGSFGGANMFNPTNSVDLDDTTRELPEGFAIIHGYESGQSYASIRINPSNVQVLLPAHEETTKQEQEALKIIGGIKSGYRAGEFLASGLGNYRADNPLIQSLATKELVRVSKVGISITTKGRNAR